MNAIIIHRGLVFLAQAAPLSPAIPSRKSQLGR